MEYCNYCNKEKCEDCINGYEFIPKEKYKEYFTRGFIPKEYRFDTTNKKLKATTSIEIGYVNYCPYCGERMFNIQANYREYKDSSITGYCCLCDSALRELEYIKVKEILKKEYIKAKCELEKEYRKDLVFNKEKLSEIKYKYDLKRGSYDTYNIFNVGKNLKYENIF